MSKLSSTHSYHLGGFGPSLLYSARPILSYYGDIRDAIERYYKKHNRLPTLVRVAIDLKPCISDDHTVWYGGEPVTVVFMQTWSRKFDVV